jgi:PAS domain S-box-containing protein
VTPEPGRAHSEFLPLERRQQPDSIFKQLLEAAPDAVVVVDGQGRIVFANAQTECLFGYAPGVLLGELVEMLIPEQVRAGHVLQREAYAQAPRTRPMGSGLELYGCKANGSSFPIEISLSPVQTADGRLVSASIRDISARKEAAEELRNARALAEAASSAKSEFLASMSHELRTPLNAVLGFAQLLQRDRKNPLSTRQLERVDHVLRGGEHLLRLIDDVLDLARIESGRILVSTEVVAVTDVLAEVKATLDPLAARAEMTVLVDGVSGDALSVVADRTRLKQILMNYGSNALKYGRPRGCAVFRAHASDGVTRIEVEDDGIGIARDKQLALFQPFQRAGQETGPIQGTGIGLVISKRLAELMGGGVGFSSLEGQGSTFWVELPRPSAARSEPAAPEPPRSADSALSGAQGPRYCVVYVEDNPSNIAFMRDLLADFERVQLIAAATAEVGIELARTHRPDVIIMDINLPGMSGIEASNLLRQWPETRDIPVIALSAAAMIRDAARVTGAGFYRYLTKPVKVDELTATLEELLVEKP